MSFPFPTDATYRLPPPHVLGVDDAYCVTKVMYSEDSNCYANIGLVAREGQVYSAIWPPESQAIWQSALEHINCPSCCEEVEARKLGETQKISNGHDPKPLRYQFDASYKDQHDWEYELSGPKDWIVRIRRV